ncbi:MAG: hypothetical protein RSE29_20305, partial [Leclercia sp.]
SFAGVHLRAIVPWITQQWQHREVYGKAYLCKAAVIFGYDFSIMQQRCLFSVHHGSLRPYTIEGKNAHRVEIYQN